MPLRRRLALFIDPSLTPKVEAEPELRFDLSLGAQHDQAASLARIARALEKLEPKIAKRRPRNVWCQHPELHEEAAA